MTQIFWLGMGFFVGSAVYSDRPALWWTAAVGWFALWTYAVAKGGRGGGTMIKGPGRLR